MRKTRRPDTARRTADPGGIQQRITDAFEALPAELRKAARYVTSNGTEVAFRSMRSVAKSAGVSPPTMVRLAKALGMSGYDELRRAIQQQMDARPQSFLARAQIVRAESRSRWMDGIQRLVDAELANIRACVADIDERDLERVAELFARARRIYVLGLRGMYPAAFFFDYSARTFTDKTVLVHGTGATHLDTLRDVGPADVVLVFTCRPYPRDTLRGARFARERGARIIAVTDGTVSPAARGASVTFKVNANASSLLSSAATNMLVSQMLAAVLFAASGRSAVAALRRTDEQVALFDIYDRD
jgi:DNA-binding MurR/RpiR family transcriptional regulator